MLSSEDDELALRAALHKARAELGADAGAKKLAARVRAEPEAQAEKWDTRRVREALRAMECEAEVAAISDTRYLYSTAQAGAPAWRAPSWLHSR